MVMLMVHIPKDTTTLNIAYQKFSNITHYTTNIRRQRLQLYKCRDNHQLYSYTRQKQQQNITFPGNASAASADISNNLNAPTVQTCVAARGDAKTPTQDTRTALHAFEIFYTRRFGGAALAVPLTQDTELLLQPGQRQRGDAQVNVNKLSEREKGYFAFSLFLDFKFKQMALQIDATDYPPNLKYFSFFSEF